MPDRGKLSLVHLLGKQELRVSLEEVDEVLVLEVPLVHDRQNVLQRMEVVVRRLLAVENVYHGDNLSRVSEVFQIILDVLILLLIYCQVAVKVQLEMSLLALVLAVRVLLLQLV